MSLYYEAAAILDSPETGSFKSHIYSRKDLRSNPGSLYAVVSQTAKWSAILREVVEKSEILREEKKLTPALAVLLTHDLLLSKGGVAAPTNHPLKLAITRHRARLNAEFTKLRIRNGFSSVEALWDHVESTTRASKTQLTPHPRWIRVNTLRTTLEEQLQTTFAGYKLMENLEDICNATSSDKFFHVDSHVPGLLALPRFADFTTSKAYRNGEIILQDKASCFPAYLLAAEAVNDWIVDACSAPGNKTTHLASLLWQNREGNNTTGRIFAFEKDESRSRTLRKMVNIAGADFVYVKAPQDFLDVDPFSGDMQAVTALLLDPSCSGSGIVSRDDVIRVELPAMPSAAAQQAPRGKKRKRKGPMTSGDDLAGSRTRSGIGKASATLDATMDSEKVPLSEDGAIKERLEALSFFQLRLLTHAMRFPSARRISYSTCSVHWEENERVVFRALASAVALERGWRIMTRAEQPPGLKSWDVRGFIPAEREMEQENLLNNPKRDPSWTKEVLDSVIRCDKGTKEGTMGFFVAGFVRDALQDIGTSKPDNEPITISTGDNEEEWNGFSDSD